MALDQKNDGSRLRLSRGTGQASAPSFMFAMLFLLEGLPWPTCFHYNEMPETQSVTDEAGRLNWPVVLAASKSLVPASGRGLAEGIAW